MKELEEDAGKVQGLVFVSDGSRGANKVAESLRQRDKYRAAIEAALELATKLDRIHAAGTPYAGKMIRDEITRALEAQS